MRIETIDGNMLKNMFLAGVRWLGSKKELVNALNVFPVPDGDTGTNMSLTFQAVHEEIKKVSELTVTAIAEAAALGALMGARGNSGVIASQLLRGIAQSVKSRDKVTGYEFARALEEAALTAYKAVMRPVEGTILTVAKEAGKGAIKAAKDGEDVVGIVSAALSQAKDALDRTPEMLPALKAANVVDAGGQGYVFLLEGFVKALLGTDEDTDVPTGFETASFFVQDEEEELTYRYCTELILKGQGLTVDVIKADLAPKGDCLLVVGAGEVVKIHLHTNNPGYVLEYCANLGEMSKIKIDNMAEQHKNLHVDDKDENRELKPEKPVGVVAVATGKGLSEVLVSLGVDTIVQGGQTMNPSTEELLRAVKETPAEKVILLPNNSNIIFTAQQVQSLCEKEVFVLPTRSIPQAITALFAYNPEEDFLLNVKNMENTYRNVKTGEVTYAVRDATYDDFEIKQGNFIGLLDDKIVSIGDSVQALTLELVRKMADDTNSMITVFYGTDVEEAESRELLESLTSEFSDFEIELHSGGQPLYYYIISVE